MGVYPQKRHKNIIIWEDINVLTHFFPKFSLKFKIFKPCDFCSSKYGQFYEKHKIFYLLKHTRKLCVDLLTFANAKTLRMV